MQQMPAAACDPAAPIKGITGPILYGQRLGKAVGFEPTTTYLILQSWLRSFMQMKKKVNCGPKNLLKIHISK